MVAKWLEHRPLEPGFKVHNLRGSVVEYQMKPVVTGMLGLDYGWKDRHGSAPIPGAQSAEAAVEPSQGASSPRVRGDATLPIRGSGDEPCGARWRQPASRHRGQTSVGPFWRPWCSA